MIRWLVFQYHERKRRRLTQRLRLQMLEMYQERYLAYRQDPQYSNFSDSQIGRALMRATTKILNAADPDGGWVVHSEGPEGTYYFDGINEVVMTTDQTGRGDDA